MDITFEDVAHVIQDARYQQAILDTNPKPDKRIPGLPRSFNQQLFMEKYDICCATVMAEPLGRWFLSKFTDLDEKIREKENALTRGAREESHVLDFVTAVYELRRRDPDETVPFEDVLALLREFQLDQLDSVNRFLGSSGNKAAADSVGKALAEADAQLEAPDEENPASSISTSDDEILEGAGPAGLDDSGRGTKENGAAYVASKAADGSPAGPDEVALDLEEDTEDPLLEEREEMVRNETQVSRYDPNRQRTTQRATGVTMRGTRTTAQGSARLMMLTHRGTAMRPHTARSKNLNVAVQSMMEALMQPVYDRFVENRQAFTQYLRFKSFAMQPIGDRQIRYHRVLGQGAFGIVHGCIVAQTGTMLAMKIMSKKKIKVKRSKSQVVAERFALEALALHPSPYCMRLRYAYQTKEAFHLILPLAIGGDLKFHLRQGPFDEDRAKFYAAEIAVGVGHIHSLGFIMRDLKPRNILLDSDGHCKISDFGLAASIADGRMAKGRAGTEGYWAPEVINGQPYGIDADWWSYGCCLFELLTGFNPFSCKHTGMQTRNEGTRKATLKFTKHVTSAAKPLLVALLDRNVETRLGCRGKGVEEVLSSKFAFWRGLDMRKIRQGTHEVPWVPEKGVIYAASQSEMMDNDDDANAVSLRRVKLTPEDIPEFDDFVDLEDHMNDIVKVLHLNTDVASLVNSASGRKQRSIYGDRKKSLAPATAAAAATALSCVNSQKCVVS